MIVSWKWLQRYLRLEMSPEELAQRLSLAGLNHEESQSVGADLAIDLEVTSNRGDCLGHIGVAREIAVLYDLPLSVPDPQPAAVGPAIGQSIGLEHHFSAACARYTARLIRDVQIGPSPDWLIESLQSVFWKKRRDGSLESYQPINNVVDITNYVLMESGQPLHAFDFGKLRGKQIIVRPAGDGELLEAIDHRTYVLDSSVCVIADQLQPIAIAGVMGGRSTEVDAQTRDVLIEAAIFSPLSVRRTARKLKLHSPSSYRFERRVDPAGVDWASRRCCELILQCAGGKLAADCLDSSPEVPGQPAVTLRWSQLPRVLGIQIDQAAVQQILTGLGCQQQSSDATAVAWIPPSWRHDLTREVDLVEEVARIYGYDKIPEDVSIPVAASEKRRFDVAAEQLRHVLTAAGISEAMTPSVVIERLDAMVSPWTERPALQTQIPMLEGARHLRRSLLPSLIQSRAANWAASNTEADLFELAHIYLPGEKPGMLPSEQYCVAFVMGSDFYVAKGVVEAILRRLGIAQHPVVVPEKISGLHTELAAQLRLGDRVIGVVGQLDDQIRMQLKLPAVVVLAELDLAVLLEHSSLVPQFRPVSAYPSIQRDLNFIVQESVRWADLQNSVRSAVGSELVAVRYRETYRDPSKDGENHKRILLSVDLQRNDATLTGDEADLMIARIVQQCERQLGASLLDAVQGK